MPVSRRQLVSELDKLLRTDQFNDYCPNGLQVEGCEQITRIVSGVTASQALIARAVDLNADLLLVHHGYFWRGESPVITGIKQQRIRQLLAHNINLLAYHLPLDSHGELGNNAQLASILGFEIGGELTKINNQPMGLYSDLAEPIGALELARRITSGLGREPQHIAPGNEQRITRVAWCTGAAQSYIEQAVSIGAQAFISGEISEPTVHIAREQGIHYFAAGHHATERYGVRALGNWIAERFELEHQFIDIDNPV
ncbi:Nif3-like dinuclear metal center hexameric protein [Pseudohongiella spirulinae]|uniref:GTP cyclohydrolase 1 type 2 homolog n=1 Tax=Pseudohongiella spirulinae TaxID=1249552 RepID=A0A0S2KFS6_9GAMM|nr:Nif3-like dinuclear metal center hexameric protein [Pseudohongiella spirulinae]ALO46958.1 NGG1p interacting factor 3 protein, NIF3 [Pseudohongiella spirulinae]